MLQTTPDLHCVALSSRTISVMCLRWCLIPIVTNKVVGKNQTWCASRLSTPSIWYLTIPLGRGLTILSCHACCTASRSHHLFKNPPLRLWHHKLTLRSQNWCLFGSKLVIKVRYCTTLLTVSILVNDELMQLKCRWSRLNTLFAISWNAWTMSKERLCMRRSPMECCTMSMMAPIRTG